jgi:D-3-phosphoglycerate dehydrogenase
MVNVQELARQRDIDVAQTKHERDCDYQTLIRVTVITERQERSVAGTLFGGTKPRLVNVKGIELEAQLGPHMLYTTNHDRPGAIADLSRTLADAGINVATFNLGRDDRGGEAIALIELDEPLPPQVLERVRALPQIKQAEPLTF